MLRPEVDRLFADDFFVAVRAFALVLELLDFAGASVVELELAVSVEMNAKVNSSAKIAQNPALRIPFFNDNNNLFR